MTGFEPKRAAGAAWRLIKNRDDLDAGGDLIGSLAGQSWPRLFARWRKTHTGQTVSARKMRLEGRLGDRYTLAKMDPGSLGRAYLDFMNGEGLDLGDLFEGLGRAIPQAGTLDDSERIFYSREKAAHDLWHVVTGHGRDYWGETCLVFWMLVQHRNTGAILPAIVSGLFAIGRWGELRREVERAKAAAWLPAVFWEGQLQRPLADVRRDLGIS